MMAAVLKKTAREIASKEPARCDGSKVMINYARDN